MVTKDEFNLAVRGLLFRVLEHQMRVIALQKAMETRGDIPIGWVETTLREMRSADEYLRVKQVIDNFGNEPEVTLDDILRQFEGPIQ